MSSLDKEAIQHIEGMSKAGVPVENIDYKAVLVPDGMQIKSLQDFQEFKNRYTGGFSTDSLESFSDYVSEQSEATCFVHTKNPIALAIFDLGTIDNPLHAVHRSLFSVEKTAAFEAVGKIVEKRADQESLAEFMEDWRFYITLLDKDGEELEVNKAIAAVRKMTIEAAGKIESEINQLSTTKSTMETIEARGSDYPIPSWITFTCSPYKCVPNFDFPIRVNMSLKNESIGFVLKVSNMETIQEDIANSFADIVSKKLGKTKVYLGEFDVNGRLDMGRNRY